MIRRRIAFLLFVLVVCPRLVLGATLPPRFAESTIFSGLSAPTVVKFASDGRIFIAEKSGLIKVFANLTAPTPTIFADLRTQVFDYWDRGLLGMVLDPAFPTRPYVYVLYTLDKNPADATATIPTWGDTCPTPPGATASGCPALGRLSRLDASAPWPVQSTEQVLIEGFGQQFPSHSLGNLAFGPDGALYVTSGDGASFIDIDWGQFGGANGPGPGQRVPANPLGDPPAGIGSALTPPTAQGGALRAQSVRRPAGQPVVLNGALLRVDPNTGAGMPDNPMAASTDANARRILAYGFRNPFRFVVRPGTSEIWLGDVGWTRSEEINRIAQPVTTAPNFGWPCYEGPGPQPSYQAANLSSCASLYQAGTARAPFFSYDESASVIAGDGCPVGTSSISGLAFYGVGNYPATYANALFFTDWARRCIWAMLPDAQGVPNPSNVVTFASGLAGGAVYLEIGPNGDLYYVDYDTGRLVRIIYFGDNQPPTAVPTATPTSGASPLLVQFDASGSQDPEGGPLFYFWDFDGDGTFTDATTVSPTFTFTTSGKHTVRLITLDLLGGFGSGSVDVYVDDQPPVVTITSPVSTDTWKVGDVIDFAGTAVDPEDGALPASAFHWTLLMHHCPSNCHIHTIQQWDGIASGTFTAPDHDYPSWLELTLTVTDVVGQSAATSVALQPQTVQMTIQSVPAGLSIAVGPSADTTPFTRTVIAGSNNSVAAATPQGLGGQQYFFSSWSDSGAASHQVIAPTTDFSLTATYQAIAALSVTQSATTRILKGGRIALTATATNAGPSTATAVVLTETIPAGVDVLSMTPPGACTANESSVTCILGALGSGVSADVTLTLRARQVGTLSFDAAVSTSAVDPDTSDNSASAATIVAPVGDFNGDGKEDLLWRNSASGRVSAWFMNGTTMIASADLVPSRGSDLGWRVGAIADFDGDGHPDLVWRNQTTGVDEIWLMNGMTRQSVVTLPTIDPSWQVVSAADFNDDGWPDLLFHHTSGLNIVAYMTGTTITGGALVPAAADSTWQVVGTLDVDGDGVPDHFWHHTTDGLNYILQLSDTAVTNILPTFGLSDLNWVPVSFADVNGDGRPDLVLWHRTIGVLLAVYLDGATVSGGALLPGLADTTWVIVGPR